MYVAFKSVKLPAINKKKRFDSIKTTATTTEQQLVRMAFFVARKPFFAELLWYSGEKPIPKLCHQSQVGKTLTLLR